MRKTGPVTQQELDYPSDFNLITTTDLDSRITAANQEFLEVAGYQLHELMGQPHNMIRHPDMPQQAFANLWQSIEQGNCWRGLVKNRCKNGDHYWVDAFVTPIRKQGRVVEYQSVRVRPDRAQVARAETVYRHWRAGNMPRRYLARPPGNLMPWLFGGLAASVLGALALSPLGIGAALAWPLLVALIIAGHLWHSRDIRALAIQCAAHTHPAMPYIYTGRRGLGAWLAFEQQTRNTMLRAVSARMYNNVGTLQEHKSRTVNWVNQAQHSVLQQKEDLQTMGVAFRELNQSVHRINELALQTHQATEHVKGAAQFCEQQMADASQNIGSLFRDLEAASQQVASLAEKSAHIGSVLEVISGIAEQTNLLALNAAIEAARAGEQGRGFAVVADEVRALANRTHDSTRQIADTIASLQQETRATVATIGQGAATSDAAVSATRQASEALRETLTGVTRISGYAADVAAATEQQSALSGQVNSQAEHLLSLCNNSADSSAHARDEADALAASVDQAYLLSAHFLQMLCYRCAKDGLRGAPAAESIKQPETQPAKQLLQPAEAST
ncbi:MAG: methyl-accepting chemotaxis protein [Marinobacter sp.]|nr:methyl-accepting chemotaxis protein [Marinobacter sp.]